MAKRRQYRGDNRDDGRHLKINLLGRGFLEENKTKGGHQKLAILRGVKDLVSSDNWLFEEKKC